MPNSTRKDSPAQSVRTFIDKGRSLLGAAQPASYLSQLLSHPAEGDSVEESVRWLQEVVRWLRLPSPGDKTARGVRKAELKTVRLRFVLGQLERNAEWRVNMAVHLQKALLGSSGVHLFAETGLSQETGFFSEALNRVAKRLIPAPPNAEDLSDALAKIFPFELDADWIRVIASDEALMERIVVAADFKPELLREIKARLRRDLADALMVLSSHLASVGTSAVIRARLSSQSLATSPFLKLNHQLQNYVLTDSAQQLLGPPPDCTLELEGCRVAIAQVYDHLEATGVSVDLVYKLDELSQLLARITLILDVLAPKVRGHEQLGKFIAVLVRDELSSRSLAGLVRANTQLLARKVVERTGETGEHYIMRDRREYNRMLGSAAGGGVLTVGTTAAKYFISTLKLPMFFEGFFSALNYSGSFLFMQFCGFTLATKQPSMTAAALAAKLSGLRTDRENEDGSPLDVEVFVDEFVKVARSQFAAALGNIGLVIPSAILADWAFKRLSGHSILDEHYAHHAIEMLDLLKSPTVFCATLTGFLLWFSSFIAGWVENWVVFRRIPEALAQHAHVRALFGDKFARRMSKWFSHHVAGLAGNTSLGTLLAFTPVAGRFFGLPIDVRHVTLSTGALTLAVCSLSVDAITTKMWLSAIAGIVVIGILNFGVSFALALWVASRARNVQRTWLLAFLGATMRRFARQPLQFLYFPASKSSLPT